MSDLIRYGVVMSISEKKLRAILLRRVSADKADLMISRIKENGVQEHDDSVLDSAEGLEGFMRGIDLGQQLVTDSETPGDVYVVSPEPVGL